MDDLDRQIQEAQARYKTGIPSSRRNIQGDESRHSRIYGNVGRFARFRPHGMGAGCVFQNQSYIADNLRDFGHRRGVFQPLQII